MVRTGGMGLPDSIGLRSPLKPPKYKSRRGVVVDLTCDGNTAQD